MIEEIIILHRSAPQLSAEVLMSCREDFSRPFPRNRAMPRNPMPREYEGTVE